jgi:hypothetical protein
VRSEGRQHLKVNVFYMAGKGKYQFNDEGVIGVLNVKEVVDKALASGIRITQRPPDRMRRRISSKSKTYTEDVELDVAGRSVKVFVHNLWRSPFLRMLWAQQCVSDGN